MRFPKLLTPASPNGLQIGLIQNKGLNYDNTKEDKIMLQNYISNSQNKKKDESLYNKLIALNLPKR